MDTQLPCQNPHCENTIPEHAIKKAGSRRPPRFCSFACAMAARKAEGFYQEFSQLGNARLREIQVANSGVKPGREKRSKAMAEHNKQVPRKHVSGWHKTKSKKS